MIGLLLLAGGAALALELTRSKGTAFQFAVTQVVAGCGVSTQVPRSGPGTLTLEDGKATLTVAGVPAMTGTSSGGGFGVAATTGAGGKSQRYSAAGSVQPDGSVKFVLTVEAFAGQSGICTSSYSVVGRKP